MAKAKITKKKAKTASKAKKSKSVSKIKKSKNKVQVSKINKIKKKKERDIIMCPQCGSTDVSGDYTSGASIIMGNINRYRCKNCNFSGPIFPRVTEEGLKNVKVDKNKVAKLKKENQKIDTTFYEGRQLYLGVMALVVLVAAFVLLFFNWIVSAVSFVIAVILFYFAFHVVEKKIEKSKLK